ncbi:hypothetical protein [Micromonospora endolithica]|uniref:Uncharacterized protein n=1 Tax=Micromonospora endolithica TaxID=230091 RepID=A0A3A9YR13_9ACTN|nr:hypothetical protein [Micromonospora endolithica]RKN38442.1 hypothetical protein D7223_31040 [Micromonospora endolithica]TWJ23138.1 hypothetical protein JD76_03267 [Micromonospora endolithica]
MPTIIVTGRHRPHEVMFLVLSSAVGAAFVAGAKPPTTLEQLVQPWVLWTWYLLLLGSGVIGLVSIAMPDTYRALVLELAAMHGQTAAPLLYGVALLSTGSGAAGFAVAFFAGWSAASAWRGWQVWQGMRVLRQVGDAG